MTKALLTKEWIDRLGEFTKLFVGFSGGLDSTVLLHALASEASLHDKIVAVYINHNLSAHAHEWQKHCEQWCNNLGIEFITHSVHFDRSANIEERARTARYDVFSRLLTIQDCLLLGHHLDDQAETVLLHLFRGAGIDGLAAMTESNPLGLGILFRPFLSIYRETLELYAASHDLCWIEDESNQDVEYSRNYLRHQVMPLLKKKWPQVVSGIARAASHCQQAEINLDELALKDSQGVFVTSSASQFSSIVLPSAAVAVTFSPKGCYEQELFTNRLYIQPLKKLSFESLSNVLRFWLKQNKIKVPSTTTFQRLINEVMFASQDAVPKVSWGNVQVRRYKDYLYLDSNEAFNLPSVIDWSEFPKDLTWPDNSCLLTARIREEGMVVPQGAVIQIKFRQGGEEIVLFGQTKKLKKLFQEWGIPYWLRDRIPLVYINGQLAAVIGYAVSDLFYSKKQNNSSEPAYLFCLHLVC